MRIMINESAENYLETILMLSKTLPVVRSVDIANELGFSKPSVSVAMKNLRENGYVSVVNPFANSIYLFLTSILANSSSFIEMILNNSLREMCESNKKNLM